MRLHPLALLLPLACAGSCGGGVPARPNVILISIDTLRPDHLGCYGYGRKTSPFIDRLAAEGVLFEEHVSSTSWTLPAHAAMFTSVSDTVHGCVEATGTALAPEFTTLAERFMDADYRTGGFYAGPYLHSAFGLGQGFETYVNCAELKDELDSVDVHDWGMDPKLHRRSHSGVTNDRVYGSARSWIEKHREEPFFAFVHLWDVHYDFTPPPKYATMFDPDYDGWVTGENFFFDDRIQKDMSERDRTHLIALYDGEIRWTDTFIGKLRNDLEAWGLADDTILVITSDHGTEFFEHGEKGHRRTLFDESIRIPLVIHWPGRLEPRRVSEQSRMIDLGPTLLELAGLPVAEGVMGRSLVPLARGKPLDFDNTAVSELFSVGKNLRTARSVDSKFLFDGNAESVSWYDLIEDPGEAHPRTDLDSGPGERAQARYLRAAALLRVFTGRRAGDPVVPEVDADTRRWLEENGYVGGEDEDD